MAEIWDRLADYWDNRSHEFGTETQRHILYPKLQEIISNEATAKILDAGCGNGWLCRLLALDGFSVTGIDVSAAMIEHAKSYYPNNKDIYQNIKYYCISLEDFQIDNDSSLFDVVISLMTTHTIYNVSQFFVSAHRVLQSNGRLLVCIEHPFFSILHNLTSDHPRQWLNQGNIDISSKGLDDFAYYELRIPQRVSWDSDRSTIKYFRTLEDYSSLLCSSGFYIYRIHELTVSLSMTAETNIRYPKFLLLELIKRRHHDEDTYRNV